MGRSFHESRGRKVKTPWWPCLLKNRGKKTAVPTGWDNTRLASRSDQLTAEFFQHGPHGWLPWYPEVSFRATLYTPRISTLENCQQPCNDGRTKDAPTNRLIPISKEVSHRCNLVISCFWINVFSVKKWVIDY